MGACTEYIDVDREALGRPREYAKVGYITDHLRSSDWRSNIANIHLPLFSVILNPYITHLYEYLWGLTSPSDFQPC